MLCPGKDGDMAKKRGRERIFEDFYFYVQDLRIYHVENDERLKDFERKSAL